MLSKLACLIGFHEIQDAGLFYEECKLCGKTFVKINNYKGGWNIRPKLSRPTKPAEGMKPRV